MPRASRKVEPAPLAEEELATIHLAKQSFPFFLTYIFPECFRTGDEIELFPMADATTRPFSLGRIHYTWAQLVQDYNRVCILAPRLHLKSTVIHHGLAIWRLMRAEADYYGASISYKDDLASSQTERIKTAILKNRYLRFWIDRKTTSDSIVDFKIRWSATDEPRRGYVRPFGILGNIRGEHPDFVIADDILSDLSNPLEPKQIEHIDNVFNQVIANLPRKHGPIDVIGTPQSYEDTLYKLRNNPQYVWARFPAEWKDRGTTKRRCLWPEVFDFRMLNIKLAEIKQRAYDVEYLLTPIQSTENFFPDWAIESLIDPYLVPADPTTPYDFPEQVVGCYAGVDVGKELHPSHVSVGALLKSGHLVQIYEQFLEGMPYPRQVEALNMLIKNFRIKRLYYDATRAELDDRGLNRKAIGVKFTRTSKAEMALALEARVFPNPGQPGLVLLNDDRQKRLILSVNRRFQAVETSEGHSDAAFSVGLMCKAADDGPVMVSLGDASSIVSRQPMRPQTMGRLLAG